MFRRLAACLAVLTALSAPDAFAQPAQTGTIAGVIQDASGGVLPGVTVTATSQERGTVRSVVSDENGRYVFAALSIGSYTVEANLSGFAPVRLTDNLVETEKTTSVPVTLKVGGLTDSVTVTGETPIVDLTNVTANTRVRKEEFERLPVGRSYQSLIAATPGVVGGTVTGNSNVNSLGALTFPLVLAHVHEFLTVTDGELVEAMRFLWERMKLVVEPTGALATAGVLSKRLDTRGSRVGIILSGGNVDLRTAAQLFA